MNMRSIMGKVRAFNESPEGKRRIRECLEKYRKEGRTVTEAGDKLVSEAKMREAAARFIQVLRETARDIELPESVMSHFNSLEYSGPHEMPDGSRTIYVYFADDLHRDSLQPDRYGGVDNIIAVLNNGYDEHENMAKVWGVWHGMRIHALTERTGLHFIQRAVDDFNGNYGSEYRVVAKAEDIYQ